MTGKKYTKKKVAAKKKNIKITQRKTGQGHNINIKIDQSKRSNTTKREPTQKPQAPQIITTFTPQMAPPPPAYQPMPFYSQPPQNPFYAAIQSTQAPNIKEEPNELERPRPREEAPQREDENIPLEIKKPKTKKIITNSRVEEETMGRNDFDVITGRTGYKRNNEISDIFSKKNERKERESMAQEDGRRKNRPFPEQPDLSEIMWFNPSRTTYTPLEEQAAQKPETINTLVIYEPKKKTIKSGVHTMTDLIEANEGRFKVNTDILNDKNFRAFMGSGNILNKFENDQKKKLSQEELRNKRLQKLEQPQPALFEPKIEKVINAPAQEPQINEPAPEPLINKEKISAITVFQPKRPKPKANKAEYIRIETLKNMSYKDELKQQEEEWKRREEEQKELRKKYANLIDIDDADRRKRYISKHQETFFERNPTKTLKDFNEWLQDYEEQQRKRAEEDKISMRERNEREAMGEHDIPTRTRQAKEDALRDESREGYKDYETIKREKEYEEYRKKIKKMSYNELKQHAKSIGLKQPKSIQKQELLNLILKNRD